MDQRVTDTLTWLNDNDAAVCNHPGAAYQERELLRELAAGNTAHLFQLSNLAELQRGIAVPQNRNEVYRLTHYVMFATDFGRIALTGVDIATLGSVLENLLQDYANDTDVLGEILLSIKLVGTWNDTAQSSLDIFTTAWTALDRNNFAESYHPILVGGLLFKALE